MLERLKEHPLTVILPNGIVFGFVRVVDLKELLACAAYVVTIGYTIYLWIWLWRKNRKKP